MVKVNCLNKISKAGMKLFSDKYEIVDDFAQADAALVRSAAMHDMELGDKVLAVARAGIRGVLITDEGAGRKILQLVSGEKATTGGCKDHG